MGIGFGVFSGFLVWVLGFFENSESVALLLLLQVTKQESNLVWQRARVVVGCVSCAPALLVQCQVPLERFRSSGWEICAADTLFVSGLSTLAATFEVAEEEIEVTFEERKASKREGASSGV